MFISFQPISFLEALFLLRLILAISFWDKRTSGSIGVYIGTCGIGNGSGCGSGFSETSTLLFRASLIVFGGFNSSKICSLVPLVSVPLSFFIIQTLPMLLISMLLHHPFRKLNRWQLRLLALVELLYFCFVFPFIIHINHLINYKSASLGR